jgi:hypothetical protein
LASVHGFAVCGTGDSFVKSADLWLPANKVDVVDMELTTSIYVLVSAGKGASQEKVFSRESNDE